MRWPEFDVQERAYCKFTGPQLLLLWRWRGLGGEVISTFSRSERQIHFKNIYLWIEIFWLWSSHIFSQISDFFRLDFSLLDCTCQVLLQHED